MAKKFHCRGASPPRHSFKVFFKVFLRRNDFVPFGLVSEKNGAAFSMKFTVEIVRPGEDGGQSVLHRATADEISPKRAKVRADTLLHAWRGRGATLARVLNPQGEELYVARARQR